MIVPIMPARKIRANVPTKRKRNHEAKITHLAPFARSTHVHTHLLPSAIASELGSFSRGGEGEGRGRKRGD